MEYALIILTILLPILKFVLFPARTMGRGGSWTIVGAIMIVCMMMALWFGMQSLTDTVGSAGSGTATGKSSAATDEQTQDLDALQKLLQ